jgi:hypothetical protein
MATTQLRGSQILNESVNLALDVDAPINTVSAGLTLDETYYTVICNTNGGAFTVTLPTAIAPSATVKYGPYRIKNSGTNALSIATTSAQTIDGKAAPLILLSKNSSVDLISDQANWWIN